MLLICLSWPEKNKVKNYFFHCNNYIYGHFTTLWTAESSEIIGGMQQRSLVKCLPHLMWFMVNTWTQRPLVILTYISQVKGYLKVPPEVVCKTRVDIKDLQQVVPQDAVQITVGDCVDIWIGFSWLIIQVYRLPKYVILFCKKKILLRSAIF